MPKNVVETEGPEMTSQYGAYVLHAGLARVHVLTHMHARAHRPIACLVIFVLTYLFCLRACVCVCFGLVCSDPCILYNDIFLSVFQCRILFHVEIVC